jgi:hypothetical protein
MRTESIHFISVLRELCAQGVGLYLEICLPRWLSQLVSLPLATEKDRVKENILFGGGCLFSAGQILTQVPAMCGCVEGEVEDWGEHRGGLWVLLNSMLSLLCGLCGGLAWEAETHCAVREWRENGWLLHAQTTSCPSTLAHASFGDGELEKNLVASNDG